MKLNIRQKILKLFYPAFIAFENLRGKNRVLRNKEGVKPLTGFYDLTVELMNGQVVKMEKYKGKKVMIVNTASDCGYTAQFNELQKLYRHSKEDLEIIAFPSNDFGEQEKGTDQEIENFCINNFSIRFPMAKKSRVKKSPGQHQVFQWLTSKEQNGWLDLSPRWNFSKYIINEEGELTYYFDPAVSPVSEAMIKAVNE